MKVRNILLVAVAMVSAVSAMAEGSYKDAWTKGYKEYKSRKYKESMVTLQEAAELAKSPNEKYSSMIYLGYSLRSLKKYDEAEKVFKELLEVEKLSDKQKNNVFNQYLNTIYYAKKYDKLLTVIDKTMADDTANTSMKSYCAYLAYNVANSKKNYADAEKWGKKLQELNPKGTWYNRGVIFQANALRLQKKVEEAAKLLEDKEFIAKMGPHQQTEAYLQRGHIKAAMGKHGEAALEFIAVYEIPKGNTGHRESAIVYVLEKFNAAGKLEEADVWIEKVDTIKLRYWKTRGYMRAAQILQKQGKLKEAKAKWEECVKLGPWWKKEANKQIAAIDKKLGSE